MDKTINFIDVNGQDDHDFIVCICEINLNLCVYIFHIHLPLIHSILAGRLLPATKKPQKFM